MRSVWLDTRNQETVVGDEVREVGVPGHMETCRPLTGRRFNLSFHPFSSKSNGNHPPFPSSLLYIIKL